MAAGGGTNEGRAERSVLCHNPDAAERDAAVRQRLIEHLPGLIDGSDSWSKAQARRVRRLPEGQVRAAQAVATHRAGQLRIDHAAAAREPHYDGKWLLRTSDLTATPPTWLPPTAAAHGGTPLARLQEQPRAAPRLPPP